MGLIFSVGFPTGMEGLTYPIPFSNPEVSCRSPGTPRARISLGLGQRPHDHPALRARGVSGSAAFLGAAGHLCVSCRSHHDAAFRHRRLVLPMRRDIVVTAKQIATLDHLSNGRLEIGVGIGAYREEFEALNPEAKVHRGDMVEEGVAALRRLFSQREASFEGKYYRFKNVELFPKPKQQRLPIYFGGNNPAHLRRTALSATAGFPRPCRSRRCGAWWESSSR